MNHDLEVLIFWIRIVQVATAISVTSFPILYAFKPWRSTITGRLLMLQGVAFAMALDVTALFAYWRPSNLLVMLWIDAIILTFIAIATSSLTWWMWRTNSTKKIRRIWNELHR
jgi:hypothetical protein